MRRQERLHWSGTGYGQIDTCTDHPLLTCNRWPLLSLRSQRHRLPLFFPKYFDPSLFPPLDPTLTEKVLYKPKTHFPRDVPSPVSSNAPSPVAWSWESLSNWPFFVAWTRRWLLSCDSPGSSCVRGCTSLVRLLGFSYSCVLAEFSLWPHRWPPFPFLVVVLYDGVLNHFEQPVKIASLSEVLTCRNEQKGKFKWSGVHPPSKAALCSVSAKKNTLQYNSADYPSVIWEASPFVCTETSADLELKLYVYAAFYPQLLSAWSEYPEL